MIPSVIASQVERDIKDFLLTTTIPYAPFLHQERAFERLKDTEVRSTMISTGAGRGDRSPVRRARRGASQRR